MKTFKGIRLHPATVTHPYECPYCDSVWVCAESLDEHVCCDHEEIDTPLADEKD